MTAALFLSAAMLAGVEWVTPHKARLPVEEDSLCCVSCQVKGDADGLFRYGFDCGLDPKRPPQFFKMRQAAATTEWSDHRFFVRISNRKTYPTLDAGTVAPVVKIVSGGKLTKLWVRDYAITKVAEDDFSRVCEEYRAPFMPMPKPEKDCGNLIRNSSFELGVGLAGVRYRAPYKLEHVVPKVTVDETTAAHGRRSLRIDATDLAGDVFVYLPQVVFEPAPSDAPVYAMAFSAKADRPLTLRMIALNNAYDSRTAESLWLYNGFDGRVTTAWTRCVREHLKYQKADGILTPRLAFKAPAVVWIDAVQLEKGDGRISPYTPYGQVEAAFSMDGFLQTGLGRRKVGFAAVNYTDRFVRADFTTDLGDFALELPGNGRVERTLAYDSKRYGMFSLGGRFKSNVCDGSVSAVDFGEAMTVPEKGDGFFVGVNAPTLSRRMGDDPTVLVETTAGQPLRKHFSDLRRFGARVLRIFALMRSCNPERGVYDFSALDDMVDGAREAGLESLLVIGGGDIFVNRRYADGFYTNWFLRAESKPAGKGPMGNRVYFLPRDDDWTAFVAETARHFKGRIGWYEIVNEPNITVVSPETYVHYLKLACRAIRENDAAAKIVGICSTGDFERETVKFVDVVGQLGAFDMVDVLSFHPYDTPVDNPLADGEAQTARIRAMANRYRPGLPILQDEVYYLGYGSQAMTGHLGDALQKLWWPASHLVRRYAIDLAAGNLGSISIECGSQFGGGAGCRGDMARCFFARMVPNDRFLASAAFAHFLEGGRFYAKPKLPAHLNGFVFLDRAGREIALVWARTAAKTAKLALSAGMTARDQWGNALSGLEIEVGEDVVYLLGSGLKEKIENAKISADGRGACADASDC